MVWEYDFFSNDLSAAASRIKAAMMGMAGAPQPVQQLGDRDARDGLPHPVQVNDAARVICDAISVDKRCDEAKDVNREEATSPCVFPAPRRLTLVCSPSRVVHAVDGGFGA